MQLSQCILLAFAGFSSAHLYLSEPMMWGGIPLSSPLAADGSDYPCQNAAPVSEPQATLYTNVTNYLKITGSAAHGGGSGQLAFTLDFPPTKDSKWYTAQSWEGNHPFKVAGNFPADPQMQHDPIPYMIPDDIPSGKIVMAWNWWNKIGNREHYMKCTTVDVKSSHSDRSRITNLPTTFRANSGNGCIVPENTDGIKFKYPGQNLVVADGITPTPILCDNTEAGSTEQAGSGSDSQSAASSNANSGSYSQSPASNSGSGSQSAASSNANSGSYSQSPASSNANSGSGSQSSASSSANSGSSYSPPTSSSAASSTASSNYNAAPTQSSGSTAPVSAQPSGPCVEGTITCNPDNTWSQCGSGVNQLQGKIPLGMVCKNNSIVGAAKYRRDLRFSDMHRRRSLM